MILVRDHLPEDRASIERVLRATGVFSEEEVSVALELFDLTVSGRDPDYRFLCAESESNELVGYVCFGEIPLTRGSFDLYWIVVDPHHGRRGAGRALVDEMAAKLRAEGGRKVYVETSSRAPYSAARAFYLRSGFSLLAEYTDFYSPGDTKVVYVRDLAAAPLDRSAERIRADHVGEPATLR